MTFSCPDVSSFLKLYKIVISNALEDSCRSRVVSKLSENDISLRA
jgi:hypothetical protein